MTDSGVSGTVRSLLDIRLWAAFDIDAEGRVLAGNDDLGSLQLVEVDPDGTTTALTDLPSRCAGRYVPGRRQVLVEHDNGGDEKWQISLLDLTTPLGRPARLDDLTPVVSDPDHMNVLYDVTSASLIYSTNRRNDVDMDIVVRDLDTGQESVVFDDGGYVIGSSVSHDERSVAVTRLSLVPASTLVSVAGPSSSVALTDAEEPASHFVAGWAADDQSLVVSSDHAQEFHGVWALGLDGSWRSLVTSDDHDVAATLSRDGSAMVVMHHVDGADTLAVHEADGTHRVDVDLGPVHPLIVRWSADGSRFVVAATTPTDPGSILSVDAHTGAVTLLVDGRESIPPDLRERLVTPTVHRIPTPDGEQVPCFRFAAAPTGDESDAALARASVGASVLHIHGGPESEAVQMYSAVWQALALCGFEVLVPNVRGSSGYGRRWVSLDDVELRLDSVADLAAIHDWLPTVGLDASRSALWGGSYGGYMVLAGLAMQPERWAAGVDIVGISSLVTFLENTSAYRRAYREREYGFLDQHREFLEKASPLTYLDDLVAPLFVIHGANDPRVPLSEAEQIKAALDDKGVDCELRVYPDEGHGLAKRANRLDAYPDAIEFLVQHLSGSGG
ncbi:S9 family peptidase [Nocardioides agariphilus]|uniref:S9 family peptidase n=1 Tax=Nocardioides agariphilus TaxID=433664 RepID=UPI00352108C0